MKNIKTFIAACIASGKYVKSEDTVGLCQEDILAIEDTLNRHCDSKARCNTREIVENSKLINCPYCEEVWDLNKNNACQCGASVLKTEGLHFTNNNFRDVSSKTYCKVDKIEAQINRLKLK